MRRGGGLNRVQMMMQQRAAMSKVGQQVNQEQQKSLAEQLDTFTKNLEAFAAKYKDEIKFNPDFREKFYKMCIEIGVDPLASISLWGKNSNLAEFYYNLAIQIITISMTRGPLIELNELRNILKSVIKNYDVSIMDIEKAIESVSDLKCGFQIVNIKNSKAVVTIPMEKSSIMDDIIELASENGGWIGYNICKSRKGISPVQFEDAIERLMSHGVAWRDEQNFIHEQPKTDNIIYWFPGIIGHKA
ncbi:MAG: EAP30/Vps36 family vacuolar-sorting protein [archaeon]|nr:EAP30/Vps36 family vacuolar-sorting protein [archaeon]